MHNEHPKFNLVSIKILILLKLILITNNYKCIDVIPKVRQILKSFILRIFFFKNALYF